MSYFGVSHFVNSASNPAKDALQEAEAEPEELVEAEAEEEKVPGEIVISTQVCVRRENSKRTWLPDFCTIEGKSYIRLSKWDPGLCFLVRGRGMTLHKSRGRCDMSTTWWNNMASLRLLDVVKA